MDSERSTEDRVPKDDAEAGTVDDWFGQNVARDEEAAEQAVDEAGGDMDEAEDRFEEKAEGEERYQEGHPRPD